MAEPAIDDRRAFADRLRLQLQSRYRGTAVGVEASTFSLRVSGAGIEATLPLAPLHHACQRDPHRAAGLIADYVARVERQLTPGGGQQVSLGRLLWCVRSRRYLENLNRSSELIREELGAGMVAFIAESLPGTLMRGVPAAEVQAAGHDEAEARAAADATTAARFAALVPRIRLADRIPADGWRLASDALYQGSVLTVPDVLEALVERSGGEVLIAVPDRALVLAMPAALPNADRFSLRVVRAWREAMNPCSRDILAIDRGGRRELPRRRSRGGVELLTWLRD